jgi:transcriptional regulator GlxA family with amidase domain
MPLDRTLTTFMDVAERLILIVAFDGVTLSDIVGPSDVFHLAAQELFTAHATPYVVKVASINGGLITSSSGLSVATEALADIDNVAIDTMVVPGGGPPEAPPIPQDLVQWVKANASRASRICAVCTGTFVVAEAGLAEGRRVTTHWQSTQLLQSRYPDAIVDADPIFLRDGNLWSSAGFAAGTDLALALIESDLGHVAAMALAQRLVLFLKRPGTQSQLSQPLTNQVAADKNFARLQAWIAGHLAGDLRVERLAEFVGMAPRTFARQYTDKVGETPAKTVGRLRLDAACRALLESELSLKQIARSHGFGDEQNLRRTFLRHLGVCPTDYRERSPEHMAGIDGVLSLRN